VFSPEQMSDTQPHQSQLSFLSISRHVSRGADPFNGHIDEFHVFQVQRSDDGCMAMTWNHQSDPVPSPWQALKSRNMASRR
jgi:hypothetical protein